MVTLGLLLALLNKQSCKSRGVYIAFLVFIKQFISAYLLLSYSTSTIQAVIK